MAFSYILVHIVLDLKQKIRTIRNLSSKVRSDCSRNPIQEKKGRVGKDPILYRSYMGGQFFSILFSIRNDIMLSAKQGIHKYYKEGL